MHNQCGSLDYLILGYGNAIMVLPLQFLEQKESNIKMISGIQEGRKIICR